jgi:hypothetical protein
MAEANAHLKVVFSATCLDQGRQKAEDGIGMQAAGRSHKMEVVAFLSHRGIEALGTGNGGDLDRSKSPSLPLRNCRGTRPVGEVLVGALLEYDAVGAGSPLFCFDPGVPSSRQQLPISAPRQDLAGWERHMRCCDASQRHEARALSYFLSGR